MTMLTFVLALLAILYPYRLENIRAPGDEVRRAIQPRLARALTTGDFSQVAAHYTTPDSAMLIGDASGVRWEQTNGFIDLDESYAVASQSKVVAALAIYRVMAKEGSNLSLASKPSEFFPSWPTDVNSSKVTLAHLLAFTSGIASSEVDMSNPGCARQGTVEATAEYWIDCVYEIGNYKAPAEPGTFLNYGPWHLMVAAAMAMESIRHPLTAEAWISLVHEEVYKPAGIAAKPRYEPIEFGGSLASFPDLSGGMVMTARELGLVSQAAQFGHLLPNEWLERFFSDEYGENVTKKEVFSSLAAGTWRYAQGHWISCDVAAVRFGDMSDWPLEEANTMCEQGRAPEIHHSVGAFGAYAWMDLSSGCYGVLMHNWLGKVLADARFAFGLCLLLGVIGSIGISIVRSRSGSVLSTPEEHEAGELQQELQS